jgi:hypothetical protein
VVFVCFDDPKKVRARMSVREDIYDDDQVEIILDTFHDRRRAYAFQTTPLGVQWDAIWTEASRAEVNGNWDTSFDTVWDSRGKVTSRGYVVWMAIPFKSLRFPATKQQEWGIILYRGIYRKNEDSFWPRISRKVEGRLGQEATLYGLEGISPGRDIELIPYGDHARLSGAGHARSLQSVFSERECAGAAGHGREVRDQGPLCARYDGESGLQPGGIGGSADHGEPEIRSVFSGEAAIFSGERRLFRTPFDLFFTRNIQDPSAGIRLTGKEGPYSVGLMATDDRSPGLAVPSYCPPTSLGVFERSVSVFGHTSRSRG